jgi:hypothetical protein
VSTSTVKPSELPLCDIVMEGGVTSGVIYPRAVVKLSESFRLKNIGGTSAGAIAAAVSAAAELGRARNPATNPGYTLLAKLPDALAELSPDGKTTRLLALFQPAASTKPLFTLLTSALNAKSGLRRAGALVLGAVRTFFGRFVIGVGTPLVIARLLDAEDVFTWIVCLLLGLVIGIVVLAFSFWNVLTEDVVENGYGICRGYEPDAETKYAVGNYNAPLTLWLSRMLNVCADRSPDGPPVTFGDLWAGVGVDSQPPEWLQKAGMTQWRYIDLQMMTTNVTHGRPYRFPFVDDDQHLFFRADELEKWFPPNVVKHMVDHARDYPKYKGQREPKQLDPGLYMLPASDQLPVVFVARLSLSFPLLVSAVPLWAPDFEARDPETRTFERCWFSDGGISSNFPIHFFDAALPLWPTFGLKLEDELTRYLPIGPIQKPVDPKLTWDPQSNSQAETNRFFLPAQNEYGRGESWSRFDLAPTRAGQLIGFLGGLLDASRNWRDRMLTRAPGVRDRVVRIYLKDGEGGLNLKMEPELVTKLASLGEQAAERLIERFEVGSSHPMGMNNHRWVRLRNLSAVLERDLGPWHRAIYAVPPSLMNWPNLVRGRIATAKSSSQDYPVTTLQEAKLLRTLDKLAELSKEAADPPSTMDGPKRANVVRIVPNV